MLTLREGIEPSTPRGRTFSGRGNSPHCPPQRKGMARFELAKGFPGRSAICYLKPLSHMPTMFTFLPLFTFCEQCNARTQIRTENPANGAHDQHSCGLPFSHAGKKISIKVAQLSKLERHDKLLRREIFLFLSRVIVIVKYWL